MLSGPDEDGLIVVDDGLPCPALTPEMIRRVLGQQVPVAAFNSAI